MATEPHDRETCLGLLLKDPRSSHRTPSMPQSSEGQIPPSLLRGDAGGGWGQRGQEKMPNRTPTSSWNTDNARCHAVGSTSTGAAKPWGQRSDVDCGVWNTKSDDDGWPTTTKAEESEETEGKEWTPRDSPTWVHDATMKGADGDGEEAATKSQHKRSRLYAFNAKISEQPCSCLIKVFGSNEDTKHIQISKDSDYTVWEVEGAVSKRKDIKYKFVGIFTNPVDFEHFVGGRWKGAPYEMVEVPSIDGNTVLLPCYSSKANARHSAAARALDCLSLRSTDGEEAYSMCIDQPYLDPADAPSLPRSAPVSNGVSDSMLAEDDNVASSDVAEDRNAKPPKAQLQQYYQERYLDFESIGHYFHSFDNGDDHHMLHTSVFTDPTNGTERFTCGCLNGNGKTPLYEITSEADSNGELVDVVWYRKKKDAEHAAAARALDCIRLRESGSSLLPRLCSDDPYTSAIDAPSLPLRFQLDIETLTSESPVPIVSNRKLRPIPMETEDEVAHRQEYRLSRMP